MSVIYVRRAAVALFFQGVGGGWFVGSKARVLIQIRFSDVRAETKQLAAHWINKLHCESPNQKHIVCRPVPN